MSLQACPEQSFFAHARHINKLKDIEKLHKKYVEWIEKNESIDKNSKDFLEDILFYYDSPMDFKLTEEKYVEYQWERLKNAYPSIDNTVVKLIILALNLYL